MEAFRLDPVGLVLLQLRYTVRGIQRTDSGTLTHLGGFVRGSAQPCVRLFARLIIRLRVATYCPHFPSDPVQLQKLPLKLDSSHRRFNRVSALNLIRGCTHDVEYRVSAPATCCFHVCKTLSLRCLQARQLVTLLLPADGSVPSPPLPRFQGATEKPLEKGIEMALPSKPNDGANTRAATPKTRAVHT